MKMIGHDHFICHSLTNLRQRLHGRAAAVFRVVSGPQSLCAEAYLQLHGTLVQRLLVGVTNQKRHTQIGRASCRERV